MEEDSKRGPKGNQRNFAESEIKHFIRSHDKNAENAIFRTRDEGTSILGEIYNAGNNCRSKEKGKTYALDGHLECNWTHSKLLKSINER